MALDFYLEAAFLDHVGEEHYLIYFIKEESTKKSVQVSSQSMHPINERHREYKKNCWEGKTDLEPLLDLDRIKS